MMTKLSTNVPGCAMLPGHDNNLTCSWRPVLRRDVHITTPAQFVASSCSQLFPSHGDGTKRNREIQMPPCQNHLRAGNHRGHARHEPWGPRLTRSWEPDKNDGDSRCAPRVSFQEDSKQEATSTRIPEMLQGAASQNPATAILALTLVWETRSP